MKFEMEDEKLRYYAKHAALLLVLLGGSYFTYHHIPRDKHTQNVQIIQVKTNNAGHPVWVLGRPNKEIFEMEFDNDIPQVSVGVAFRDIVYRDHGSYRHLVKIQY